MENILENPEHKQDIMVLVGRQYLKEQKRLISELESKLQATSTNLNTINFAHDVAKTKINELEGKLIEKEGKINSLTDRNTELEKNQSNFDVELNTIKDQKISAEISAQNAEIKLAAIKSQLNKSEDNLQIKEKEIVTLNEQILKLRQDLENSLNDRNNFRNELNSLRDQNLELQKHSDGVSGKADILNQSLERANNQLKGYEIKIEMLESKIKTIEEQNQAIKSQNQELEALKSGNMLEIAEFHEKLNLISEKKEDFQKQIVALNSIIDETRQYANRKENELQMVILSLKENISVHEGKNQELKGIIDIRDLRIQELEHSFKVQGEILTQKEAEIKNWQSKFTEIETQIKGPIQEKVDATRITCPFCHATDVNKIEDKKNVLSYIGYMPIYAKKYQCPKCGHIWT